MKYVIWYSLNCSSNFNDSHYLRKYFSSYEEAENYFFTLKGDSWMIEILTKWAEEENVDINYIKKVHEENLREKGHIIN